MVKNADLVSTDMAYRYWGVRQVMGRAFVCLFLELPSWPSQSAKLPTAKAKLATTGIFSEKSLPIICRTAQYSYFLPRQDGGTSQIQVNLRFLPFICVTLYASQKQRES